MTKYIAIQGREMVLLKDGKELTATDLADIQETCGAKDHFAEEAMQLEVLHVADMSVLPSRYERCPIRAYFANHDEQDVLQVSRGKALAEWRMATRYCSHCGGEMVEAEGVTARLCKECGTLVFPRIEPCIIVLVHRDGKILLANHAQRNQDIYACIAGFVEAGETIEHAVEREIYEETQLRVTNVRYFGSQSWPFPSQLMLAFNADYAGGEIVVQQEEIRDAQWFDPWHCPASPQPGSIAYRLIEAAKESKN